jgi:excisionase family DNA binding protein
MQDKANTSKDSVSALEAKVDLLIKLTQESQSSRKEDGYIDAKEAAAYLRISEGLFNKRLSAGVWTSYKIGRRRVFRQDDLDKDLAKFKELSKIRI